MTTRQSHAASHRNSNYKVEPTVISGRKAIVVQIPWTQAPVIKTTVRKAFKLSVLAKDTKNWTNIQRGLMTFKAGQVVHFTESSEHPGWYYITIVGESCTCTAGLYKQECHHQKDAVSFEARRKVVSTHKMSDAEANVFFMSIARQEDARREETYLDRMHARAVEHNRRAAAQEYRIVERPEFGDFIPEYRCLATGWETFLDTRPAARDLALSVRFESREEAEAFLAKQPVIAAAVAA